MHHGKVCNDEKEKYSLITCKFIKENLLFSHLVIRIQHCKISLILLNLIIKSLFKFAYIYIYAMDEKRKQWQSFSFYWWLFCKRPSYKTEKHFLNEITGILLHIDSFLGHVTQIFLLYRDCFLRYRLKHNFYKNKVRSINRMKSVWYNS